MLSSQALNDESRCLHAAVRDYAERYETINVKAFEELALRIARFQRAAIPGFGRLVQLRQRRLGGGAALETFDSIPPVPVDVFRYCSHFAFEPEAATHCFQTSGTTQSQTGRHWIRDIDTYRYLSVRLGRRALISNLGLEKRPLIVALMPFGGEVPTSSLNYMCQRFMEEFDGRGFDLNREADDFHLALKERWLLGSDGVDVPSLRRVVALAAQLGQPMVILATSFSLVMLLDVLNGVSLPLPPGSVIMPTGGFKARTREISTEAFKRQLAETFGPSSVVSEYGMTELSSQLYEGSLRGGALHAPAGVFLSPPWLRVTPLSPLTLLPVPSGEPGLASFVDLANIDSAIRIVTQDRIVKEGAGIRLLGRQRGAPLRGCSLAIEALDRQGVEI